jgi:hypothetical protein
MPHVLPSLRAYNLANLLVVEHPAAEGVPAHTVGGCDPEGEAKSADEVLVGLVRGWDRAGGGEREVY